MNPAPRSTRAGYSLMEVLIAFAILSMVLVAMMPRQATLSRQAATAEASTLALDFAMSRLATIGLLGPLTPGSSATTYRDWTIITAIKDETLPAGKLAALRLSVTISSTSDDAVLAHAETIWAQP